MYLTWNKKTITDFSEKEINSLYNEGYVFTRLGKGQMDQTRSVRVDLSKFELSSENRRILKKTDNISLDCAPLPYSAYTWEIGKMGKDFYATKFGDKIFSANKIKELLTNKEKSNFNSLLIYRTPPLLLPLKEGETTQASLIDENQTKCLISKKRNISYPLLSEEGRGEVFANGYTICHETNEILHYCYPFYDLTKSPKDMGLGMMLRAIVWAKEQGKKFVYLGSASRTSDTYKFQFTGVEWFDGKKWTNDLDALKKTLSV